MENQLETLVVRGRELNRGLVAKVLALFLKIDGDTCSIIPGERWEKLNNESKIIMFFLARKAMKALDLAIENEGATPTEIETELGIKGGSVRPVVRKLLDQRIVARTSEGRYFVPNYSIEKIRVLADMWMKED